MQHKKLDNRLFSIDRKHAHKEVSPLFDHIGSPPKDGKTMAHTLSPVAEQLLGTWRAMDVLRMSASNSNDYSAWYAAEHQNVVIDGPMHICDQCGGSGNVANSWDASSAFHPCYACGQSGLTTYPAYSARIYAHAHPQMADPGYGDFSDIEYAAELARRDEQFMTNWAYDYFIGDRDYDY